MPAIDSTLGTKEERTQRVIDSIDSIEINRVMFAAYLEKVVEVAGFRGMFTGTWQDFLTQCGMHLIFDGPADNDILLCDVDEDRLDDLIIERI